VAAGIQFDATLVCRSCNVPIVQKSLIPIQQVEYMVLETGSCLLYMKKLNWCNFRPCFWLWKVSNTSYILFTLWGFLTGSTLMLLNRHGTSMLRAVSRIWRPVCETQMEVRGEPATVRWLATAPRSWHEWASVVEGRAMRLQCQYSHRSVERSHWRRRQCLRVEGIGNGPLVSFPSSPSGHGCVWIQRLEIFLA